MTLILITPPAAEPLTAAEAKARLGIGSEITDAVMDALIKAARQTIENQGLALITQTWDYITGEFPSEGDYQQIYLPLSPVQSITSVSYVDGSGDTQTVAGADYYLAKDLRPYVAAAYGVTWPTARAQANALTVSFVAGYGATGASVPEPIRNAIALKVRGLLAGLARDPTLTEESVDGVGSQRWTLSEAGQRAFDRAADALLSEYRVPFV